MSAPVGAINGGVKPCDGTFQASIVSPLVHTLPRRGLGPSNSFDRLMLLNKLRNC